jgi:hypothetical protein
MYKAFANTGLFTIIYLAFVLPLYAIADAGMVENGLSFSLASMSYVLCMVAIWAICLIRGAIIDKPWLVLIPTVAFVFDLTPALTAIPFVPYVYHLLAILIGASSSLATLSRTDTFKTR